MSQTNIQLQCKNCGGNLTIDSQREVLICPFCGSEELITDSDAVAVEKIRQKTTCVPLIETARQELLRLSLPLSAAEGASAASRQLATFTTYYMGLCF